MSGLVEKFRGQALLERLAAKDSAAFAEVYDLYVDRIYRYVALKLRSREDAEDIAAEVFKRLWQYVCDGGREIDNLNALIYQIARNLVADHYRDRSRAELVGHDDGTLEAVDVRQLELMHTVEQQAELTTAIQRLPPDYRDVILLRYVEGLSTQDIAQIMDRSKGAVRVLLHRATDELRHHLTPTTNDPILPQPRPRP